ncbi:hypothetical protein BDV18DRAFT_106921 [Aspergillus unguis]
MIAANADTELPHGDSSELILVQATPKERVESLKLNSTEWKGPLSLDAYLVREDTLSQQNLTKNRLICWILVGRREPKNARTILSSCETYRKNAVVALNGTVKEESAQGVGSVFCRPEFRGKGYAKRMLEELSKKMDKWNAGSGQAERPLFSILFSDIGKKFYAQFGWRPHLSSHFALPPISEGSYSASNTKSLPEVTVLRSADVNRQMCSTTVLEQERKLLRAASLQSAGHKIAIVPDFDHFVWHWAREEFFAQQLHPNKESPTAKGAGNYDAKVYCAWNRNFGSNPSENTLYILRWVYDEPASPEDTEKTINAMAAILRRAQLEAHKWNMANVISWNPSPLLEKAIALLDPTAKVVHREKDSIAALRWTGNPNETVEWFLNEKYAWC